jgi:TPR repeat protein
MKLTLKHVVVGILLLSFGAPVVAGSPEHDAIVAAVAAGNGGDYATELRLLRPLADQGVADAQHYLGYMYYFGEGVPQDYAEAMKWFLFAANQGVLPSQFQLGNMYDLGKGVPQDLVRAHMWFNLGAAKGDLEANALRDIVEQRMTPAQIAEAQKLAREWKPTKQPPR